MSEPEWIEKRRSMNLEELDIMSKHPEFSYEGEPEWAKTSRRITESLDEEKVEAIRNGINREHAGDFKDDKLNKHKGKGARYSGLVLGFFGIGPDVDHR